MRRHPDRDANELYGLGGVGFRYDKQQAVRLRRRLDTNRSTDLRGTMNPTSVEARLAMQLGTMHIEHAKLAAYNEQLSAELAKAKSEITALKIERDALKSTTPAPA